MPSTHKKISPWVWVAGVSVVCAVVYGALSSYPRELAVYSDELRYLDVARSLVAGPRPAGAQHAQRLPEDSATRSASCLLWR